MAHLSSGLSATSFRAATDAWLAHEVDAGKSAFYNAKYDAAECLDGPYRLALRVGHGLLPLGWAFTSISWVEEWLWSLDSGGLFK
jgi:hypothetical protein